MRLIFLPLSLPLSNSKCFIGMKYSSVNIAKADGNP